MSEGKVPTLEELEQFKERINQLGGEIEQAQKSGWSIAEVEPRENEQLMPKDDELQKPLPINLQDKQKDEEQTLEQLPEEGLLDWSLEDDDADEESSTEPSQQSRQTAIDEGELFKNDTLFNEIPETFENVSSSKEGEEGLTGEEFETPPLKEDFFRDLDDEATNSREDEQDNEASLSYDSLEESADLGREEIEAQDSQSQEISEEQSTVSEKIRENEDFDKQGPEIESLEKEGLVEEGKAEQIETIPEFKEEKDTEGTSEKIALFEEQLAHLRDEKEPEKVNEENYQGNYIPLTETNFAKLQKNLNNYPLNLKIAVQNEIGNGNLSPEASDAIVGLILRGVSPRNLSNRFFEFSGKKVLLPKNVVMSLSQEELNKRHQSFLYQFSHLVLPWLRIYTFILVLLSLLLLAFFFLFYRPFYSNYLYRQGWKQVAQDRYAEAEKNFYKARYGWNIAQLHVEGIKSNDWYLRYAEAYRQRYNFVDAQSKFKAMLQDSPEQRTGWLQYVKLLMHDQHDYKEALIVIKAYQSQLGRDSDSLLLLAQLYTLMAKEQPEYYLEAQKNYRAALSIPQTDHSALLQALNFALIEQSRQASPTADKSIKNLLSNLLEKREIRGEHAASILSNTARYLMDTGYFRAANTTLKRALKIDSANIDVYLQFSYYYRQMEEANREREALEAVLYFIGHQKMNSLHQAQLFYTYNRLGQLSSLEDEKVFWYTKAIQHDNYLQNRYRYNDSRTAGEVYGHVADLLFEKESFDYSKYYYETARELNYQLARVNYRLAYVNYRQENWKQAINLFYEAQQARPENAEINYALATSLLESENWQSAAGFYLTAEKQLDRLLQKLPQQPDYRLKRRRILTVKMKSLNNRGAALAHHFRQTSEQSSIDQAHQAFLEAISYQDALAREPEMQLKLTASQLESKNLLAIEELELVEQEKKRTGDLVLNSLPRRNIGQLLQGMRAKSFSYPLTEKEIMQTEFD